MAKLKRFILDVDKQEHGRVLVKAKNKEEAIEKARKGKFIDCDLDCSPDDGTEYDVYEYCVEETDKEQL